MVSIAQENELKDFGEEHSSSRSRESLSLEEEEWNEWEGTCSRPRRWEPLGANDSDTDAHSPQGGNDEAPDQMDIKKMKEDHEQLTTALLALTSHFAQVQFRIQQVVAAPEGDKKSLLKELEDFTFRGIPSAVTNAKVVSRDIGSDTEWREKIETQRQRHRDLIGELKAQLEELEVYAYHTGDAGLPQSVLLQRHKLVVEQLRDKLNLNVNGLENVTDEDLKFQLDQAISDLVSPIKMKEQLVEQLKTQISDLERFIQYLHADSSGACGCSYASKNLQSPSTSSKIKSSPSDENSTPCPHAQHEDELRNKTAQLMRKALTLIQMFAVAQFGCSSTHFQMNSLKKCPKGSHWGDLRAALEVAVNRVYYLAMQGDNVADSDYTSDCEDSPSIVCNQALTAAVRKDLAMALGDLLEHGLMKIGAQQSLISIANCFSTRSGAGSGFLCAWDLILKYYEIKNGEKYNATPARRLSQSFGLEIVGSTTITNKQMLLSTIDNIISSHSRYKRSPESHFKAFVCTALNCGKLVVWMRMIVRTQEIMEQYYQPWSYVAKTGFEDALRSLDKLTLIKFDLPVDLAIRQFQNIKDAFQ